jgi:hypothetical protein
MCVRAARPRAVPCVLCVCCVRCVHRVYVCVRACCVCVRCVHACLVCVLCVCVCAVCRVRLVVRVAVCMRACTCVFRVLAVFRGAGVTRARCPQGSALRDALSVGLILLTNLTATAPPYGSGSFWDANFDVYYKTCAPSVRGMGCGV